MACLSCEERAKLFTQIKTAAGSGNLAEAMHLLKEVGTTVKIDAEKLAAHIFGSQPKRVEHHPEQIAEALHAIGPYDHYTADEMLALVRVYKKDIEEDSETKYKVALAIWAEKHKDELEARARTSPKRKKGEVK